MNSPPVYALIPVSNCHDCPFKDVTPEGTYCSKLGLYVSCPRVGIRPDCPFKRVK